MVMTVGALIADLRCAIGADRVRADPFEMTLYDRDASTMRGSCAAVCLPASTAEVSAVLRTCRSHDWPFVARGSGTGLAGGAVPSGPKPPVVVVTTRMNRVLDVDVDNRLAWVEPGVINLDLSRAVA